MTHSLIWKGDLKMIQEMAGIVQQKYFSWSLGDYMDVVSTTQLLEFSRPT